LLSRQRLPPRLRSNYLSKQGRFGGLFLVVGNISNVTFVILRARRGVLLSGHEPRRHNPENEPNRGGNMNKADSELLKAYPDAKRLRQIGNDAEWTMTLLDGRSATVRVHAMAGKAYAIKAAQTLERMSNRIDQ
jgi:hypothetical protein